MERNSKEMSFIPEHFDGKKILIDEADKNGVFVLNGNAKENQMIQDWYHTNA